MFVWMSMFVKGMLFFGGMGVGVGDIVYRGGCCL